MIILTFIASIISVMGDSLLKKASYKDNYLYFGFGVFIYVITAFFWFWLYKSNRFAIVNVTYSLMIMLLSVGIGVFYFREKISLQEIIGVLFGVVGILLLSHKI